MEELKFCKACLATDVKMYRLPTTSIASLGTIYIQLAQIPINDGNQHICFICGSLLLKYQEFKSKCQRAHNILSSLHPTKISKQTMQGIDRSLNRLTSNLIISPVSLSVDTVYDEIKLKETDLRDDDIDFIDEKTHYIDEKTDYIDEKTDFIDEKTDFIDEKTDYIDEKDDFADEKVEVKEEKEINDVHYEFCVYSPAESPQVKAEKTKRKSKTTRESTKKVKKVNAKKTTDKKKRKSTDSEIRAEIEKQKSVNVKSKRKRKQKANGASKKNIVEIPDFEDYITVVNLSPEDARNDVLSRKELSSYKKLPYKCELCYKGYGVKDAFENHVKKHNIENGEYECEFCHLRFPRKNFLYKHKFSYHQRKFSCKTCPYVTYCISNAKTHVSSHKGKTYPCEDCDEVFNKFLSLVKHKQSKHPKQSQREIVCELCGSAFATARGLALHNSHHRQDVNLKEGPECTECGVHFASVIAWKRHLVQSSKHEVDNGCENCGETFPTAEELKTHVKTHVQSRPYLYLHKREGESQPVTCSICGQWYSTRSEYRAHVTSEHPDSQEAKKLLAEDQTVVCEICGKTFKHQCYLRHHMRTHTGERPYACGECGKTFHDPHGLYVHRTVHTKPHRCDMCTRAFTHKIELKRHIKGHLGIRPHRCAVCDKGFPDACSLRLHVRRVHDKTRVTDSHGPLLMHY